MIVRPRRRSMLWMAVGSFVCVMSLSVAASFLLTSLMVSSFSDWEWERTIATAQHEVGQEAIRDLFTGRTDRRAQERWRSGLSRLFTGLLEVSRVKAWDRHGTVLWSDEPNLIGQRVDDPDLAKALGGQVTIVVDAPDKSEHTASALTAKMAEIYVPVLADGGREVVGVMELYLSPVRLPAFLRRARAIIWTVSVGGGLVIYLLLLPIFPRALRRQARYAETLEQEVAERTREVQARSDQLEAALRQTETLLTVSQALGSSLDLTSTVQRTIGETVRGLGPDTGIVWLLAQGRDRFVPLAEHPSPGEPGRTLTEISLSPKDAVIERLAAGPLACDEGRAHPDLAGSALEPVPARSLLLQPVVAGGEVEAVIALAWFREPHRFRPEELRLTDAIARQIAISVELRRAQQQAVQQERLHALGQMASGIAHDFNNALAPIVGFSELLVEQLAQGPGPERDELARWLRTIHTSALDAAAVVRRMREFYRSRGADEPVGSVDLARLAQEVRTLTQPRWKDQARAAGRTIILELDCRPVPTVVGNEAELREALVNLVLNALDAIPADGHITVRTRLETEGPGPAVSVAVIDTGVGMTEETRRRCFEPFFSSKGEHGTGLGLSVVFGIVQRHGGTIEVQSAVGQGSTFTVRLPLRPAAPPPTPEPPARTTPEPLSILVADDESEILSLVSTFLFRDGHAVEAVASGREAMERFLAGHFDVVVTDRAMPGISGDELAAFVKAHRPEVPVIMFTGFGDLMDAEERPAGVDLVLGKPVTIGQFRAALASLVGRRRG